VAQDQIKPDLIEVGDLPVDLGRYRLHAILGTGGMARVFLADLTGPSGFRKRCALKVIHNRVAGQDSLLRNALVNEARLGGLLHHPNIVDTYDFGDLGGQPFIAMEFIDGVPLDVLLDARGTFPLAVAVEAAIQICAGLDHAHNVQDDGVPAELVHRDLKPANVMLTRNGSVKVLDFGIAKSLTAGGNTTAPGIAKGSPSYMSPEQVQASTIDRRSDIFAMGAMLVSMATGEVLFAGDSLPSILMSIVQVDAHEEVQSRLDSLESHCPPLGAVVRRCLRADPDERFSTAAELAAELKQLRSTLPASPTLDSYASSFFEAMDSSQSGAKETSESIDEEWPQTALVASGESAPPVPESFTPDLNDESQSPPPPEAPSGLLSARLPVSLVVALFVAVVVGNGLYLAREPLLRFLNTPEAAVSTVSEDASQPAGEAEELEPDRPAQAPVTDSAQDEERSAREEKRAQFRARARAKEPRAAEARPAKEEVKRPVSEAPGPPPEKIVIESQELVREASVGGTPVFSVRITGRSDLTAFLLLRPEGGDWQQRNLEEGKGNRWHTSFQLKEQHRGLCHYYFQAESRGDPSSRATLGSKKYPYQLHVR